jgi:hypothetical protein
MNTQAIATRDTGAIAESVIAKGDIAKLTPQERTDYYRAVCESVGLNPLTQPLAYITLNGKLTLYALKGATDQLRKVHNISVVEMTEADRDGVYVVTVKVRNAEGRTDIAKGAVTVKGLQGDALANALMKTETKAKRRATLSICGLGMLDESEVDTLPAVALRQSTHQPDEAEPVSRVRDGSDGAPKSSRQAKLAGDWEITKEIAGISSAADLDAWLIHHSTATSGFNKTWRDQFDEVITAKREELAKADAIAGLERMTDAESAKVRKLLLKTLHACTDASEVQEWRDGNMTAFRSMTKADQVEVVRERDARLAELFNTSAEDGERVDENGVLTSLMGG